MKIAEVAAVSIFPNLINFLDRIAGYQLTQYLEASNFLVEYQHGYGKKKCSETALHVTDYI